MAGAASGETRVPVRVADCFLFAFDALMRRSGQGEQVSLSLLELERAPDLAKLGAAAERVTRKHPLLLARLRRNWRTWLPYWAVPMAPAHGLPLGLWREAGSPGALGPQAREVPSAMGRLQAIMEEPLEVGGVHFNARLDAAELHDGRCLVGLSWRHTLIDGKGAELLLVEIARLCEGNDLAVDTKEPVRPRLTVREQILKTKPAVNRFGELAKLGFASLGGPRARPGRGHYHVLTLNEADSARLRERVDGMVGGLFPMAFYVACTMRAHERVFRHRGQAPRGSMASVPIQTRKRGAQGPLFHNQVTVFFFAATREELATIEGAARAMKQQFAEMSRARLDESFNAVLELMVRLPPALFMRVVRWQFKGEIGSFFHSHTGPFASEIAEFAGAKITNGFHLPCLGTPPGTGLFFSERNGRVTITVSWRDGCLTDEERELMMAQTLEDLLGGVSHTL
ncbi:MAG: hypothetical protein QOE70_2694 [Chthoniobacter sp.]|jgi:hypothetical protein|nr:hypothetical protein [Chthoniobacter sp.]